MSQKKLEKEGAERPVSLAPLDIKEALSGLLAVKPVDKPERKKAPPTSEKG